MRASQQASACSQLSNEAIPQRIKTQQTGAINAFPFMVLLGLSVCIPYVVFHTTIFERLTAAIRENGNPGYLMYLADSLGYLG